MSKKIVIVESGVGTVVTNDWTGIDINLLPNEILVQRGGVTAKETLAEGEMMVCQDVGAGVLQLTKLATPVDPANSKVLTIATDNGVSWEDSSALPITGSANSVVVFDENADLTSLPFTTNGASLISKTVAGNLTLAVEDFGGNATRGMIVKTGDNAAPLACTSVGTTDASTADRILVSDNTTGIVKAFLLDDLAVPISKDANGGIKSSNSADPDEIQIFQNVEGTVKFQ